MNKFKYKFTRLTTGLLIGGIVLAIACIVLNIVRFANIVNSNLALDFYNVSSVIIAVVLSIAFIVFAIFAFITSRYTITDSGVTFNFGFIKTKINASEVKEIKLEGLKSRLEIVFLDDSYFIVTIDVKEYELFVDEFRAKFTKIPYVQISEPID